MEHTPEEAAEDIPKRSEVPQGAGSLACSVSIQWTDGETYTCTRDGEHDGEQMMHGAVVAGEWTNWTDSWLIQYPEFMPSR